MESTFAFPIVDAISYMTLIYLLVGCGVIYVAWRSTFVRPEFRNIPYRQRTVFIFNPETGGFQQHSLGLLLNNLSAHFTQPTPTFESIVDEMNGINYSLPSRGSDNIEDDLVVEEETQEIIREMDREPNNNSNSNNTHASNSNSSSSNVANNVKSTTNDGSADEAASSGSADSSFLLGDEITIKLKYLNDDLKIVRARPNEQIGDFKKRNFNEELSAQKIVRLVFNGHVLQPDAKTVAACGLFDNCVVHCLIHNPRPTVPPQTGQISNNQPISTTPEDAPEHLGIENLINSNRNHNRNTQRLLNLSLFLICLSVIISWFFRIQYFQLFSWYSTVGLVLLTTFFLVIIPLIFLIEREIFRNL